jgi:flagellar biogenesis protein FliO
MRIALPLRSRLLEMIQRGLASLRPSARQLRLCESLSLGEKRLVAVVRFEGMRYLLGATPAAVTLLSRLPDAADRQEGRPCEP